MTWSAIVLAAGKGTRMQSLMPKVLHPLMAKPLLCHVWDNLIPLKPSSIMTVVSPELETSLSSLMPSRENIDFLTVQQAPPQGTGHAVKIALDVMSMNDEDVVFITAGDVPGCHPSFFQKGLNLFQTNAHLSALVFAMEAPLPNNYGRLIFKDSKLTAIIETKDASLEEKNITLCNSGILGFKVGPLKKALGTLKPSMTTQEYYITDAVQSIHENGGCVDFLTVPIKDVQGVNCQKELVLLEKIYQERAREKFLAKGVRLVAPDTVFFAHDTHIDSDVVIEPHVVIGEGVRIGEGVVVKSFSYLEGCTIDRHATIGPFARIRPSTHILNKAKVGNFVEIKNSTVGSSSKVNHLAYVGDTTIGTHTNIGAGVITCNYDGYTKTSTHIGHNVFVGSNAVLVSPLTIEDDTVIAAGSTITKNVLKDDLAVARAKQVTLHKGALRRAMRLKKKNE